MEANTVFTEEELFEALIEDRREVRIMAMLMSLIALSSTYIALIALLTR